MQFEWDEAKQPRRCVSEASALTTGLEIFEGRVAIWQDDRGDYGEERFRAVGQSEGDVLHVVFTWRGETRRIISVRRANQKETKLWLSLG